MVLRNGVRLCFERPQVWSGKGLRRGSVTFTIENQALRGMTPCQQANSQGVGVEVGLTINTAHSFRVARILVFHFSSFIFIAYRKIILLWARL